MGRSIAVGILSDAANAVVDIVEILTKVDFMPIGWRYESSRCPAQDDIPRHVYRTVSRIRVKRYCTGATSAFRRARLCPREHVIGIGSQNDLVNNKSALTRPDVQDVEASAGYLKTPPVMPARGPGAVGPFVTVVREIHLVTSGYFLAVQTDVTGV